MATATVLTNSGKRTTADRMQTTPTRNPLKYVAMGTAGTTAAITDTALGTEVETRSLGTESTQTITVTGDTYQVLATITATATRAITEAGTFDQLAVGGNMGVSATFAVINLNTGDAIQFTIQTKYA